MSEEQKATGGSVGYYKLFVPEPANLPEPYTCECEDIINALNMTFAEGNQFKAIWRSCAAREQDLFKPGMDKDGVYDAEKMVYYSLQTLKRRVRLRDARVQSIAKSLDKPST